ncbi:subunit Brf1 of transcription factor IIIB [Chloropicon primus]|uniref:B-related factor 1 n=2 Tax=Chloropicon primus TaxID=1764295 RepID=A0A5B8MKY7_9CHLO|nr:subunit Brf1 of transcription factor IIIB [Chloropicon primus]UPQ99916.1 subunit Brf1 of transcription factor IIIB [Chloropicon primus]|eukprot:QDZ20704.1 subunit Brf1 of transcription factor IIIB [Chloropicon primus]
MFCKQCQKDVVVDEAEGNTICTLCGGVLDDNVFSNDPTFLKTATGASQVVGNVVPESGLAPTLTRGPRGQVTLSFQSQDSHEKTLNRGRSEINELADRLSIKPREEIASAAHRLYKLAVQRNFTRGRRTQQVAAACLYTICRQEQKPYMLIDFSDCIQANVYLLGAVFLQLLQLLRLEAHPIISRPIDPSLYIHRFADRMNFGKNMHAVASTALRLVASMKRDWMQTGRRPAGICGAALFIASHMHGFRRKKRDIVGVVHVCEATIKKRLGEFELTPNAQLTTSEFEQWGIQYEKEQALQSSQGSTGLTLAGSGANDLEDIVKLCGGFSGGQDPPAFSRGIENLKEKQLQLEYRKEAAEIASELEARENPPASSTRIVIKENVHTCGDLSEIDDDEIDQYLHTSDEIKVKEQLWNQMNAEYLNSQPQIEQGGSGKGGKQGDGKARKRKNRNNPEEKYSADTASEATHKMLASKRLSSKINYSALQTLFDEEPEGSGSKSGKKSGKGKGKGKGKKSAVSTDDADDDRFLSGSSSGMGLGGGLGFGLPLGSALKKKSVQF